MQTKAMARGDFSRLIEVLQDDGYQVAAPVEEGGVIALRPIDSADEIAGGVRDEHGPGHYRVDRVDDDLLFANVVGPESARRFFFPAEADLFTARVESDDFVLERIAEEPPRWALLGLRSCDLAAVARQDRVFLGRDEADPPFRCETETGYAQARASSFLVAVDCTRPGGNCFCASWDTGPQAAGGFDLALTEIGATLLVRSGSERGAGVMERLPLRDAEPAELDLAELKLAWARDHMGRSLETGGLPDLLGRNLEHRIWKWFGEHCLGCGNCTLVCPTCFCSTVTDRTDLATGAATRTRRWESCFTHEFSYVTSGPVRSKTSARYRHWLNHKLAGWQDQFGEPGCVGCGRCITWCPVGIDWTGEITQLQHEDAARRDHEKEVTA